MGKDLLIEIGTEEIPARFVQNAVHQLADRITNWLNESRISHHDVNIFSTPRRMTVIVKNVAEKQEDRIEEVKGPALKSAKDAEGNWTKAAQGFAKGQGVTLDELYVSLIKDIEYIFAKKEFKGQEVHQLLPEQLKEMIETMTFPKSMKWGSREIRFVRPIRWLVALFGHELIPFEIAGVSTGHITKGHRFLGKEITVSSPDQYETLLKEQYVIVDAEKRKSEILTQLKKLETEQKWTIPIDEGLLDEVANLVEYPTVLFGSFKEEFLELPGEVLITTMREHQRYFPVEDQDGNLLPYFVTVRNGDERSIELVRKGNEKVLTARLADARFFFLEDQKLKIEQANSKLEHVVFQEGLGTVGDKVRRIKEISTELSGILQLDVKTLEVVQRTAEVSKFDLVTNMVYEFPELQGLMGEKYSRIHGEDELVSKGIFEHYLPRFSGDQLPELKNGQLVSIADKIDNIAGSFSLGKIPTGSQDPLGLRRQTAGIVQILFEKIPQITLDQLFDIVLDQYEKRGLLKRTREEIKNDLYDFFTLRLKNLLQEQGVRYDVIDAVLAVNKNNVQEITEKAGNLMEELKSADFKPFVDAFTRVINLADKASLAETDPKTYIEAEEHQLYQQYLKAHEQVANEHNPKQVIGHLKTLKEPIDVYFEKVMVMVDDDQLKKNRLGLLLLLSQLIKSYADFTKLVFS